MRLDKKLKKKLLLNAPYILFVYLFDKVAQGIRLAPGADASQKLLHLADGFGSAFASPLPSFHPMDLLIGIAGAVIMWVVVYVRGKNAKKFRKNTEYGSARWGTPEDIEPYMDPDFRNNIILTRTERLTMNSRPKDPKTARNKNVLVIGGSGSGKTRFFVKPQLMQLHSSYVVTDPKGSLLVECGRLMERAGYKIKVFNTINFKKSMHYNYFDSSVRFELSFINTAANKDTYSERIAIPLKGDSYDSIRAEYTQMLKNQLAKGNNGLIKTKYLTFGIEADSLKSAKLRLERIETDVLNNFKRLGVQADPMNGKQRLELLHGIFHMDEQQPFLFDWDWLAPTGLSVKDFIAPSSFSFRNGKNFTMGRKIGQVSFLQILAPELNDRMLADFLDMQSSLIVTMHVQSVDQVKAIRTIKRKITDLQKMTIEEQKKAVRAGYDMDIIPSDLATYGNEAKKLLQDLQSRNERMFLLTFLVLNVAETKQQLENNVFQAGSIAQKYNCQLTRLDFQQEEGLMSSLPLGLNQVEIERGMTTSSVAIFVPFTTQELFQSGKEALYCGINALSNNLIMVDRKLLKNPNGLILGTPGSGKSFAAKREIANVFFVTDDDIIICDPESEYGTLVERLGGQVIKISPTSSDYINPIPSTHLVIISYDDADGRIMKKYEQWGHQSQMSLIVGKDIGNINDLVDYYLPKPSIDRASIRMSEILKQRFDQPMRRDQEGEEST